MVSESKKRQLRKIISEYKRAIVAYSGGVDSSLLLKVAVDVLGKENVIAATAVSPTYTAEERERAKSFAAVLGIKHILFESSEFDDINFINNTPMRCYYCKSELFNKLTEIKKKTDCHVIMDGTNFDDQNDFRPGSKAVEEYGIVVPLKEAKFTKKDIRTYSKEIGLETWNVPAMACLSSRIPYNEKITKEKIMMIAQGEIFLKSFGISDLRLRVDKHTARIEVPVEHFPTIMDNREIIIETLNKLGFIYVTLDLKGFRSGSMNEVL